MGKFCVDKLISRNFLVAIETAIPLVCMLDVENVLGVFVCRVLDSTTVCVGNISMVVICRVLGCFVVRVGCFPVVVVSCVLDIFIIIGVSIIVDVDSCTI